MSSRRFNKRIEIHETSVVDDGYGGNTTTTALVSTVWAYLRSAKSINLDDFGLNATQLVIKVTVRKNPNIDIDSNKHFIKYQGDDYTIITYPTDDDFDHKTITFLAVKNG